MNMGTAMKITQAMAKIDDAVSTLRICEGDLSSPELIMIISQIGKCKEELQKLFERLLSQDEGTENGDLRKMIGEK